MTINKKKEWKIINEENEIIEYCRTKAGALNRIKGLEKIYVGFKLKIIKNEQRKKT